MKNQNFKKIIQDSIKNLVKVDKDLTKIHEDNEVSGSEKKSEVIGEAKYKINEVIDLLNTFKSVCKIEKVKK